MSSEGKPPHKRKWILRQEPEPITRLTQEVLDGLPICVFPFYEGSKFWLKTSKSEILERLGDVEWTEVRYVADYLDCFLEDEWFLSIGRSSDAFYIRRVGFTWERYLYLPYGVAVADPHLAAAGIAAAWWTELIDHIKKRKQPKKPKPSWPPRKTERSES